MIIWSELLYKQKEQELKAIDRFRNEMNLFDHGTRESGVFEQLREYLYGTVSVEASRHATLVIDASMQTGTPSTAQGSLNVNKVS